MQQTTQDGVSWDGPMRAARSVARKVAVAATIGAVALAGAPFAGAASAESSTDQVLVRHLGGDAASAGAAVARAGGLVTGDLRLIDGVVADVDDATRASLTAQPGIVVGDDTSLELHSGAPDAASGVSLATVRDHTGVTRAERDGITGAGVDIALIDSGVAPVPGLDDDGQVLHGPDLSFESNDPDLRHLDTYGHGTHLAGIINATGDATGAHGVAPGARVVSVKVANAYGATDVSQVIAAIDWVVTHRNQDGLNIRVLALAFGTDGTQDPILDPLSAAVEAAWHHGLVVVAAAGNNGADGMTNPATNPWVIAAGALDTGTSASVDDDVAPAWSSKGNDVRTPDVAAPGTSVVSLRVPGSYIDIHHGDVARRGAHGFVGSGTSQSTAVVAGMAALLLENRPELTPDQVKYALADGARNTPAPAAAEGRGLVNYNAARHSGNITPIRKTIQSHATATGTGSLDAARGTHHVPLPVFDDDGEIVGWELLTGEVTVFGTDWTADHDWDWSGGSWSGGSWSGGSWSAGSWSAGSWSAGSWSAGSWSAGSWSAGSWSAGSWSSASWSAAIWG